MTPQQYCQTKAAQSGSSFYFSFLSLPKTQREAIVALYAFCREVDDIADSDGDVQVRRSKLHWWRDEIHRLFNDTPQHPVTRALQPVISHFQLPEEHFLEIIDGMEMDLDNSQYTNYKELMLYCHRVAGVVGVMSAEIFGYTDRGTLKYAHELGLAFQLTNILRDVHEDASKGRIYIPHEDLASVGASATDLLARRQTPELMRCFALLGERARQHYQNAFQLLPPADRFAQRPGLMMAAIYQTLLREIHRDQYQVLQHRISLPPLRKLWITLRTYWRETWHKWFIAKYLHG